MPCKLMAVQLLQSHPAPDTTVLEPLSYFAAACSMAQVAFHILDLTHGASPNGFAAAIGLWINFIMA